MEEIVFNLIMHSGDARSNCIKAINLAKKGNFVNARKYLDKADEELGYAHNTQTSLIQQEAGCEKLEFSLLLTHGEDHLMTTMMFKDLAVEIVDIHEKIYNFEK